jgi:hypothetical protein
MEDQAWLRAAKPHLGPKCAFVFTGRDKGFVHRLLWFGCHVISRVGAADRRIPTGVKRASADILPANGFNNHEI